MKEFRHSSVFVFPFTYERNREVYHIPYVIDMEQIREYLRTIVSAQLHYDYSKDEYYYKINTDFESLGDNSFLERITYDPKDRGYEFIEGWKEKRIKDKILK